MRVAFFCPFFNIPCSPGDPRLCRDNLPDRYGLLYVCVGVGVCVHACPVPLVRVWLIHETEFVCGMPARHSCCMQMRKEW